MEEKTSLWNKKQADLTVSDTLKITALAPVITMAAVAGVTALYGKIVDVRHARRLRKLDDSTTVTPDEVL